MAGIRGVALITIGTVFGQALVLLVTPIVSRLYSPQDLGHLSIYISLLGMFSTTAALCYELAIPLPEAPRDGAIVSLLATLVVIATSALLAVALCFDHGALLRLVGALDLYDERFWLPVGLALNGVGAVLTLISVRHRTYGRNAVSKGLQGSVQAISQAGAGAAGAGWFGLIAGQLLGLVAGILPLLSRDVWVRGRERPVSVGAELVAQAGRYRNFPILAAPSTLINSAAGNAPALLLASFFGLPVVGLYGLGLRVLQLPTRFLGQSISQVFLGQAADALHQQRLGQFVDPVYRFLLTAALHAFVPLAILARPAFAIIFGAVWIEAGAYVQYLMPWVLVSFVATPLSMLVTVLQKQRVELWLQCGYLLVIGASLAGGAPTRASPSCYSASVARDS
jgi:O-antigen/teichoic acid export membrane protein